MTVYKDAHAIPPDATFPENGAFIGLFIEGAVALRQLRSASSAARKWVASSSNRS